MSRRNASRSRCFRFTALFLSLLFVWTSALAVPAQALPALLGNLHFTLPHFTLWHKSVPRPARSKTYPSRFVRGNALSLWDDTAKLVRPVPAAETAAWRKQLVAGHLTGEEAAKRHVLLGEWELAKNESPQAAEAHFAAARTLTTKQLAVHGLAAYDSAIVLFFEGRYDRSEKAFHALLAPKTSLRGYDRRSAALWMRHVGACAGYHAQRAEAGIVEPLRLDPLCGVEALAACLRGQQLPYDKKTVLAHSHVTGLGNNIQDLQKAGRELGLATYIVKADEEGLKRLPKPLIAHVEQDHFIAVTRADAQGVTYLCSDCGPWPGGKQRISWKQWRMMDAGIYLAAVKPGCVMDKALQQLTPPKKEQKSQTQQKTAASSLPSAYCPAPLLDAIANQIALLKSHVVLKVQVTGAGCGRKTEGLQTCKVCAPKDHKPSLPPDSALKGDPVNLATGAVDYDCPPDLTVYNPVGPSIAWTRSYSSLRNETCEFGMGWTYNYNVKVVVANNVPVLTMHNGAQFIFNLPAVNAANTIATCTTSEQGNEFLLLRVYDANNTATHDHYELLEKDRTRWVFTLNGTPAGTYAVGAPTPTYLLSQIIDRNGNAITFEYRQQSVSDGHQGQEFQSPAHCRAKWQ